MDADASLGPTNRDFEAVVRIEVVQLVSETLSSIEGVRCPVDKGRLLIVELDREPHRFVCPAVHEVPNQTGSSRELVIEPGLAQPMQREGVFLLESVKPCQLAWSRIDWYDEGP